MKRSKMLVGALAALPALGLLAVTQLADAHHPEVEASAVCSNDIANVSVKVTSWTADEPPRRANSLVSVSWDGVQKATGSFTAANDYTFSVALAVPADGTTHTVTATAVNPFGPAGEYGFEGSFRETSVTLPTDCTPPTTTVTTTTAAPQPVEVQPAEVLGTSVTRPDVAVPVEVLPRFAG
jgi:hypothetical protein